MWKARIQGIGIGEPGHAVTPRGQRAIAASADRFAGTRHNALAGRRGASDQGGKACDEARMRADGRRALIDGNAALPRQVAVVPVELHQRLGMLGDEGHGRHDHRLSLRAGPFDLAVRIGADPLQRTHPALVADDVIEILPPERPPNGGDAALDLALIRIPGLDERLGHTVRGIEDPRLRPGPAFENVRDPRGRGLDETPVFGITADPGRRRGELPPRRPFPVPEGRCAGRGGKLGIERQEDDPVGIEARDFGHDLRRHRMPVPHADEHLETGIRQRVFERPCLCLGLLQQRRPASDAFVDPPRFGFAPPRNRLREHPSQRPRLTDDGRIVEQVEQERPYRLRAIRSAEVEEDDRDAARHLPEPFTRAIRAATCSGGVPGTTP